MKIGIIGQGNVGARLASLFESAGHEVIAGTRRGPDKPEDAARHGDIVLIAIHYHAVAEAMPPLAPLLSGKIVVDCTNPLNDDWSPRLLGQENSAAEELARLLPQARLVKAFNTIFADVMLPEKLMRDGQRISAFVASDDQDAITAVSDLAASAGFSPVPINKLTAARHLEAMAHLNIELAVGQGGGTDAALLYHRNLG